MCPYLFYPTTRVPYCPSILGRTEVSLVCPIYLSVQSTGLCCVLRIPECSADFGVSVRHAVGMPRRVAGYCVPIALAYPA